MSTKHTPLNYALWLLGRRDRSIGEIKEKLNKKECNEKEINEVTSFLLENQFLDDERFAKNYIQNQIVIKPLGKYQLKMKLKRKLLPDDIIEKVLSNIGENEEQKLAEKAAKKWIKSKYQMLSIKFQGDNRKIKENLSRHLITRGFSWDIVSKIVENINTIPKN